MPRIEGWPGTKSIVESGAVNKLLLFSLLLFAPCYLTGVRAQEHPVDPTWLHRYVPELAEAKSDLASELATTVRSSARVTKTIDLCKL